MMFFLAKKAALVWEYNWKIDLLHRSVPCVIFILRVKGLLKKHGK